MDVPEVQYVATKEGHRLAWQQWGSGPDILVVPPLLSNAELVWEQELYRRSFEYLGEHVRVTAFDKRGIGLSDRFVEAPSFEQRCEDIVAVMDVAGLDAPALMGFSEGGLMAQLFAEHHPDRVGSLALGSTLPGGAVMVDLEPDGIDEKIAMFDQLVVEWGTNPQWFVDWYNPSQSDNAAFVRWTGRFQRLSATAADMQAQIASIMQLDASQRLNEIKVPTLVTHSAGDKVIAPIAGRWIADHIPGAGFVEVMSADHFGLASPEWRTLLDAHLEFVCGSVTPVRTQRCLATVVFTDIVGSTARASSQGDEQWRRTLDSHDRIAWALSDRHRGVLVKNTGDGVLLRFDSPSAALDFAREFRRELTGIGLPIRCGLHFGELEVRGDGDITGVAVNLAARVEQSAGDGEIFVSSTVRDLMLGGESRFEDRGEHTLKGLDRPWRLYALLD